MLSFQKFCNMSTFRKKTTQQPALSIILIAKNEEKNIEQCINSFNIGDEFIVVDSGSEDKTISVAKKYKARIIEYKGGAFSEWRNAGKDAARGNWLFYIDADERMTPSLETELSGIITNETDSSPKAFAVPRQNIIFGRVMKHAGQWPDYQMRFFKKSSLIGYKNQLHEIAEFRGEEGKLKNYLVHIKHDNLSDMVTKTNRWSDIEAKLLYDSGHPLMVWWRFIRIMLTELWIRVVRQKGILDGFEGLLYAIYQMWSKFITYAKLWELQKQHQIKN